MNLLFCINGGYTGPLLDCLDSIVLHGLSLIHISEPTRPY